MTVKEIKEASGGRLLSGNETGEVRSVSIDSRDIGEKALFVPLKGERSDGHDYIQKAIASGAVCVISEREIISDKCAVIKVSDTALALGNIAKYYRAKFDIKTVAVTGSVGKTTTKDMIYSVLGEQYKTLKTEGNYNNEIGLPLTALRLGEEYEAAVFEMGMSAFGEIRYLADIARPGAAVITNIGMSHIENLGSQEGIFRAKTEVCEFLGEDNILIVNGDDKFLQKAKDFTGFKVVTYGIENECDYRAQDIEDLGLAGIKFSFSVNGKEYRAHIKVPGVHNVYNALAAAACGVYYGVDPENIIKGIENFALTKMRMAIEKAGGVTVINDCYNSSPDSLRAALGVLGGVKARKVAVLGDILEMGSYAKQAHFDLGKDVYESGADVLLTAGENAKNIAAGAMEAGMAAESVISYNDTESLLDGVLNYIENGDTVLVKASRGMSFEKVTDKIIKAYKGEE